ncbi:MAG: hypothetical protein IJ180_10140 [Bacteroidales bacterium]|nr:hypothetical protein [Bacteroidales bacterium]
MIKNSFNPMEKEDKMMNDELMQMKKQIQILHNKLEKQQIVNEKIFRNSVKNSMKIFNDMDKYSLVVAFILLVLCMSVSYFLFDKILYSLIFFLFVICMETFVYFYSRKEFKTNDIMTNDIVELSKKILHMKKIQDKFLAIDIFMAIVFGFWFLYDWVNGLGHFFKVNVYGGVFGLVVGLALWWFGYRRQQKILKNVISQLEQITKGANQI